MEQCIECGQTHKPEHPHDAMTEHYLAWCLKQFSRLPTWEQAIAHCELELRSKLKQKLVSWCKWSQHSRQAGRKQALATSGKAGITGNAPKRRGARHIKRGWLEEKN